MRILSLPDDVAIGGLDAQAERLSMDAALAAEAAELLVRSVRLGDSAWRLRSHSFPMPREPEAIELGRMRLA